MKKEDFQKYLKERYEDQVNWYDKKAIGNQKVYRFYQTTLIFLSAVTPVLVAIKETRWSAIVISVLVAIGITILKTFKFQENWINYRTTCETLKKEIYLYQARIGEYKTAKTPEDLFVERVESLISRENTIWLTTHKVKEKIVDSKR